MRKAIIGLVILTILIGGAACAGSGGSKTSSPGVPVPAPAPAPAPMPEMASDSGGSGIPLPSGENRMVVHTGDISLVVKDVVDGREAVAALAKELGGYVVSANIRGQAETIRADISIRVPDDEYENALTRLREMAVRVESETTRSQDITEEYIDLQARLSNAAATEQQYLNLLERAEDVEDILRIYENLSRVRQEIEQLEGRIRYLEQTVAMSLISVRLEPEGTSDELVRAGWSALEVLKTAVRGIVVFGQVLGTVLIWLLVFSPLWGGILALVWWRYRRRKAKP
jgi:hypothetical protein